MDLPPPFSPFAPLRRCVSDLAWRITQKGRLVLIAALALMLSMLITATALAQGPGDDTAADPAPAAHSGCLSAASSGSGSSIENLRARSYGGGSIERLRVLEDNDDFTRYAIRYPSDDITIAGFMDVPKSVAPPYPAIVVAHGFVWPNSYTLMPYSAPYADALARAGYLVVHPNYRNYGASGEGPNPMRSGYAIDVLNLIAIIREQSQDPLGTLRRADADDINLWGHSMGGGVAMKLAMARPAAVLSLTLVDSVSPYGYSGSKDVVRGWTSDDRVRFELGASPEMLAAISPATYFDRLEAAVAIHHSETDDVVPVAWSHALCARLEALSAAGDIPYAPECTFYDLQPHTFRGDGDLRFIEAAIEFFDRH